MRRIVWFILMLAVASLARAQEFSVGFENPPYLASQSGFPLTNPNQDNWYNPVAGSVDCRVFPTGSTFYNFQPNPFGQAQFAAGAAQSSTAPARAEHQINFSSGDTWTVTWDMSAKYMGIPPATDNIGSVSLQDSTLARTFIALGTWMNPATPTAWKMGFLAYDAAGVQAAQPGYIAGPQWQNLQADHWYRFSASFSFSQNRILDVSVRDLSTPVTTTVAPPNWYLLGGANPSPSTPIPTAIRLFAGGATVGNIVGWDNGDACTFQVTGFDVFNGQEGTIVHIQGCGFGTDPDALSVSVLQTPSLNGVSMRVISTTDNEITAEVGPVRSGPVPGRIMVIRGTGSRTPFTPTLDDVIPEDPLGTLVWNRLGDPRRALSPPSPLFQPQTSVLPPGVRRYFGLASTTQVQLIVTPGIVQPNTTLRVITRLHDSPVLVASDLDATAIRMRVGDNTPSSAQYLADRIRDVILSAFTAHGINTSVAISGIGPSRTLIVRLLDGLGNPLPLDFGIVDVITQESVRINPFAIGPVTAFYHAGLVNQVTSALVSPVDPTGNDGATISPNTPVGAELRVDTDLIPLPSQNNSFTVRSWGTVAGVRNQLIGACRAQHVGSFFDINTDFTPIGASTVRVSVYNNTQLVGTAIVSPGVVCQVADGGTGLPSVTGCGGRPTSIPNPPYLWIDFDRPCILTPTGGVPATGNRIRVTAAGSPAAVQNIQAIDLAAGLGAPLDVESFVIFSSVEGGICYANCDGSTTPPILNVLDFACFLNMFASGDPTANCDGSAAPPTLNVLDFACFLNTYAAGCS